MPITGAGIADSEFISQTTGWIDHTFDSVCEDIEEFGDRRIIEQLKTHFVPGKMLRTRLGMALAPDDANGRREVTQACAATELIHAATLFHDDVIDGAFIRRAHPTLWREVGSTGAILIGDLFYSSAVRLVIESNNMTRVRSFVDKVREVCNTEMVHELVLNSRDADVESSIKIARGKTGPLFAFIAETCGANNPAKAEALEEAGYRLGTAYQLADDLLDVIGDEKTAGKTLGTDRQRDKFTLAQNTGISEAFIRDRITSLCTSALEGVWRWPDLAEKLETYITSDLFKALNIPVELNMERATACEVG